VGYRGCRYMKKQLFALFIIVLLLLVGCSNSSTEKPTSTKASPTAQSPSKVTMNSLDATEKAKLSRSVDKLQTKSVKISTSIDSLNALAAQKNDSQLTDLVNRINKIYSSNTILILLTKVDRDLDDADESLDEDSSALDAEIDVLRALVNDLVTYSKMTGDASVMALATSLDTDVEEFSSVYGEEYYSELEEAVGVKFDDIDGDSIENEKDTDDDGDGIADTEDTDDDDDGVEDSQDFVEEEYKDTLQERYNIQDDDIDDNEEEETEGGVDEKDAIDEDASEGNEEDQANDSEEIDDADEQDADSEEEGSEAGDAPSDEEDVEAAS